MLSLVSAAALRRRRERDSSAHSIRRSASKLCDARLSLTINAVLLELYAASMQPIVEQRREAPARGDASTTRSTRYGPVVYDSIYE